MDDVKLKIRPRQTLMSSIGKFPQRRKIEGQVQILVKRLVLTQEKAQIVNVVCVLFALDKSYGTRCHRANNQLYPGASDQGGPAPPRIGDLPIE